MTGQPNDGLVWRFDTKSGGKVWYEVDAEYIGERIEFYGRYGGDGFARASFVDFAIYDDMPDNEVEILRVQYEDLLHNMLEKICGELTPDETKRPPLWPNVEEYDRDDGSEEMWHRR